MFIQIFNKREKVEFIIWQSTAENSNLHSMSDQNSSVENVSYYFLLPMSSKESVASGSNLGNKNFEAYAHFGVS